MSIRSPGLHVLVFSERAAAGDGSAGCNGAGMSEPALEGLKSDLYRGGVMNVGDEKLIDISM